MSHEYRLYLRAFVGARAADRTAIKKAHREALASGVVDLDGALAVLALALDDAKEEGSLSGLDEFAAELARILGEGETVDDEPTPARKLVPRQDCDLCHGVGYVRKPRSAYSFQDCPACRWRTDDADPPLAPAGGGS